MTLGDKITKCRKDKGMSQVELASRLGITKQTVGKYETGIIVDIPLSKIKAIAAILDVSPEYLCGWEKEKAPELSETKKALIAIIEAMSEEDAAAALRIFRR